MTKRWLIIAGLFLVAMLAGGGIAWASIPGPDGVIHGCRKNSDGSLRAIDSAATCPSGWTTLNWAAGPLPGTLYNATAQSGTFLVGQSNQLTCPGTGYVISAVAWLGNSPDAPLKVDLTGGISSLSHSAFVALPSGVQNGDPVGYEIICADRT